MAKKLTALLAKMPPERRTRAQDRAREVLAEMALQELRRARELSQAQLAEALGENQPNISQIGHVRQHPAQVHRGHGR